MLLDFDVKVLDDSFEGILWLKLRHKSSSLCILPCVCYLPPEISSRAFDVNGFYDTLLSDIYKFQNDGLVYICGDFNSRCGDLDDFIRGIDRVCDREVIDFCLNNYGKIFIDFLINTNMCILNGRGSGNNDFTSVSTIGNAVVDYCFVEYSKICHFSNFSVIRATDLINQTGNIATFATNKIPDHSLLKWSIDLKHLMLETPDETDYYGYPSDKLESRVKFELTQIPESFLYDDHILHQVNNTIIKLESSMRSQQDIDRVYTDWCDLLKNHMLHSIPHKHTKQTHTSANAHKRHRPGKPWWCENLSELWVEVCRYEKLLLSCHAHNEKMQLKSKYTNTRKQFDREVQRAKRLYWYSMQKSLLDECNVDQTQFWKSIGKIGINGASKQHIPMEVVLEDGSVSFNISDILNKWQTDFSSLFRSANQSADCSTENHNYSSKAHEQVTYNEHISILDVKKAIDDAKKGKASGIDNIPVEVLKNDTAVSFLHVLFNICFDNGIVPSEWGKCIINPIPKSSTSDRRDPLSFRGLSLAPSMYKLYCSVLNRRLSSWAEQNDKIVDEQNGFRKSRSTTDHILSLTSIIDTRKKVKKSTFCAFVDFKKAYDTIDRNLLWKRL